MDGICRAYDIASLAMRRALKGLGEGGGERCVMAVAFSPALTHPLPSDFLDIFTEFDVPGHSVDYPGVLR